MEIDLTAFHFLRPAWLWLLLAAVLLPFVWLRRNDVRAHWRNLIAPHLLDHLIVGDKARRSLQPIHTLALLIALGAVAAAGPTWQQERPPFDQDKAPLVVVLELARSMDATDVAPTRIERAKQKVLDLAAARKGARTGLVVFASSAHLVVPPTEDPAMLDLYVPALAPSLMPRDGRNAAAGLGIAERVLANDPAGTIVFMSDGFDESQSDAFVRRAKQSRHQLLWLAVGTEDGGPIRGADGAIAMDAEGHPLTGSFDAAAIRKITGAAGIPLASMRADDDDVTWVTRRAQTFLAHAEDSKIVPRWKEAGYWLVWPLVAIALWCFRRGWTVKWLPLLLISLALSAAPGEARAASWNWIDLFATHDQQGRWSFEHGDYKSAAQRFDDPVWKGRAQYLAGDYRAALESFSRLRTPEAYFYIGNTLAHLKDYAGAVLAYDNALREQPAFADAASNRDLMKQLLAREKTQPEDDEDAQQPDRTKTGKKSDKGQRVMVHEARPAEDVWMRNLNTSPAAFLHQRFQQEAGGTP
ncbi:Tetratricopeptide repeat protein [Caballeronia arationis]|jgi:Ca-activated chloride channel family protein|uniref:von Willebrand factor type A domain-containing protein n=1 Tax=Caballeronia arationis TaxID=1777142 RepID=A0A7Z7IE19_9BURK|nr:VWA domain-containing protein [Caballeronia arationis]SAK45171.1 Tetratricopeptide repeat protein [Caballeronia arationis]SOE88433.1 von Willebrand factor type A domain-containing protein [Caballeronia arationis]